MNPIVIPCATEADWHAERAKAIGASEVAALFGVHPYLTARQLWARKKERLADTKQETEAMEAGKFAELMCAPWYEKRTGRRVVTPQEFYAPHPQGVANAREDEERHRVLHAYAVIVRHPTLPLQCTPDRIVFREAAQPMAGGVMLDILLEPTPGVLQLKNADRYLLDAWENEDGAVEPPLAYQVQLQAEMLCTGMKWGALAAVVGGNRLRHADAERHEPVLARMAELVRTFWASLSGDVSPAPQAADLEDIKRQWPQSVEGLSYQYQAPEDVLELARLKAEASANEEAQEALMAKIGSLVGPAETITDQSGRKLATWKTSTRRDPPREAREFTVRTFRIDSSILKAAKAALPHGTQQPILPS